MPLTYEEFEHVEMRVGRIIKAEEFLNARKPAFKLWIDFGLELGIKQSSAQITKLYTLDDLLGRQVIAVTNFAPRQIATFISEVLVLGLVGDGEGEVILLQPDRKVTNGLRVF